MRRGETLVRRSLVFLVMANINVASAQPEKAAQAHAGEIRVSGPDHFADVPQGFVVCTGWHALCTASPDCKLSGDKADCDCLRVNEIHIVATSEIQDPAVKHLTETKCTDEHPCDVDQAPICKAIRFRHYKVNNVKYDWVSTYSYRAWCSLLKQTLKPCNTDADSYVGDRKWALCDVAPCTENQNPSDPERPLSCQCQVVENIPFVGMDDSCTGKDGGIMSSMPLSAWDFQKNTYTFPMPGYEYVQGACAPLKSDPWQEPSEAR